MKATRLFPLGGLLLLLLLAQGVVEAQGTLEVVPYQAAGYRFKVYSPGTVPSDYGSETFDDSAFSTGDAGFGSGGGCPLQPTVATTWPVDTDLVVRKAFNLPAGSTNLRVMVSIDNDVEVFLNGVNISGGLVVHEGCSTLDEFRFAAPDSLLRVENNLLAVRAVDRGVESFLDLRVLVGGEPAPTPTVTPTPTPVCGDGLWQWPAEQCDPPGTIGDGYMCPFDHVCAADCTCVDIFPPPTPTPGAGSFNPEVGANVSDDEHDVNADIMTTFNLPVTDLQYEVLYTFTPPEFFPGKEVPTGALVGVINAVSTLGLFNGRCNTVLSVTIPIWQATKDTTSCQVTYPDQFKDANGNGLPDGIDCYPDFLLRMLPGLTPIERFYGQVVSPLTVSMNIVTFAAGALPGYPAAWGKAQVAIPNDVGDPERQARPFEPVTDYCTPLSSETITYGLSQDNPATPGDESGAEVRRNPHYDGAYTFRWYAESMRDADGDGLENSIDTCPLDSNTDLSPKEETMPGGPDQDGIDSVCDPDPVNPCWPDSPAPHNPSLYPQWMQDCDMDGFWNRLDTCPLVSNGCNTVWCAQGNPWDPSWDNQADADGDDIGDACDPHPYTPDGQPLVATPSVDVYISGPPPPIGGMVELAVAQSGPPTNSAAGSPADSSAWYYAALAGGAAAALALAAGGRYARRRWLR